MNQTTSEAQAAAASINQQIEVFRASTNREINTAFESIMQKRADALLVGPDVLFVHRRVQLVTLAARFGRRRKIGRLKAPISGA